MIKSKKYPKDFKDWILDNTVSVMDGYLEQSTQYCVLFPTIELLYIWFRREYIENARITKKQRILLNEISKL